MDTLKEDAEAGLGGASLEELATLVAGLEFSDQEAAYRSGRLWVAYAHPWRGEEPGPFDALISFQARTPEAGTATGLRLSLVRDNIIWLSAEPVDERGQIWFRGLPAGYFSASLGSGPASSGGARPRQIAGVDRESELAALAAGPGADLPAVRGWRLYHLPDRRLTALLEEDNSVNSSLLLRTSAADLANATVNFDFGDQAGAAELEWDEASGEWIARRSLEGPFAVLAALTPHFTVAAASPPAQ